MTVLTFHMCHCHPRLGCFWLWRRRLCSKRFSSALACLLFERAYALKVGHGHVDPSIKRKLVLGNAERAQVVVQGCTGNF